jgi:hypothetical protein
MTPSTWSGFTSARSRASVIAVPPRSVASSEERPPPIFPKGVLAVERMTVFDICAFRLAGVRRPAVQVLWKC